MTARRPPLPRVASAAVLACAAFAVASAGGPPDGGDGTAPAGGGFAHDAAVPSRAPLNATALVRLPLGSVRPEGWLRRQLELQTAGLTGAAEDLYDALTPDSAWLGGDGENWERGPYYVKGLVALAYTLDDAALRLRAQKWVDWALGSQREDGFFGPPQNDDWWPRMVVLYYLRDYYEATGDDRVVPFFTRYFRHQLKELPGRPLRDWGRARAGDNLDVVLWTYDRTGDAFLPELAELLRAQAYPWTSIYADARFYDFGGDFHPHHIVNVSQALKTPALAWRLTGDPADRAAYAKGVANLERLYGRPDGQVSGTEMLSGLSSADGVELCADAERVVSDAVVARVLGSAAAGDSMEKVAFNSLPAHTSPEMRQITYYQLTNQIACTFGGHGFTQDYANANVPGPYSGFPCCCYNWHMAWPKYAQHMWAATADGGLAAVAYGPSRVSATAGGVPVVVTQKTEYPFGETVELAVDPVEPATFPLLVRIPGWCDAAEIAVNGEPVADAGAGAFRRIEREWRPGDEVRLTFPMTVRGSEWVNGSLALERGPLTFSLKVDERWRKAGDFDGAFDEYEILPESPWNYALAVDPADLAASAEVVTRPVGPVPFAADAAPVTLKVPARRVPGWTRRAGRGRVVIGRSEGGWNPLASARVPLDGATPHRVRVVAEGRVIEAFVDDMTTPAARVDDAAIASGGVGLRAYETAAAFADVTLDGRAISDFEGPGAADAWAAHGGDWAVDDGAFRTGAARDAKAVLKNAGDLTDFTFEATVSVAPGGDAGLMVRASDPTAALDGYRGYYVGLSTASGEDYEAEEPPPGPVSADGPVETVELIPFGFTKLRVTLFPVAAGSGD